MLWQYLTDLQRTSHRTWESISKSSLLGAVMVLGDFNAHLGRLGGTKGVNQQMCRELTFWPDVIWMNAISLGSMTFGPCYTYMSGSNCWLHPCWWGSNLHAIMLLHPAYGRPDHLPLLANMIYAPISDEQLASMPTHVDWRRAISSVWVNIWIIFPVTITRTWKKWRKG